MVAFAMSDPRVYFAAERTLLAWVRTGVTVIGLGFVVARFGLFLRLVNAGQAEPSEAELSSVLGVGLTIGGGVVTALAALQFALFLRHLKQEDVPRPRLTYALSLLLALIISSVGVLLGIYLIR
jgi:putative membrane protein